MRLSFAVSLFAVAFAAVACGSEPTDQSSTNEALKGGCRMVCPKCTPNIDVCPMIACTLECNGKKPQTCVETQMCPLGYAWDQTKCSCEPTSTCVETVMCIQGDHWDSTLCQCVPN